MVWLIIRIGNIVIVPLTNTTLPLYVGPGTGSLAGRPPTYWKGRG